MFRVRQQVECTEEMIRSCFHGYINEEDVVRVAVLDTGECVMPVCRRISGDRILTGPDVTDNPQNALTGRERGEWVV